MTKALKPTFLLMLFSVFGCDCSPDRLQSPPFPFDPPITIDAGPPPPDSLGVDMGIGSAELLVDRMTPDHGPFIGGNAALVRGTGFNDESFVSVGGRMVQPSDIQFIDQNTLRVVLPAGDPGPADVSVTVGSETATKPAGYTYDQIYVDPSRGSVAGGTVIEIIGTGTMFADGDTVDVGPLPCADVQVISETKISCRVPAGVIGTEDVVVTQAADGTAFTIEDGFTYFDSSDPLAGGLGGGQLDGTINITAIDAGSGAPIADVFVLFDNELNTEFQGLTNLMGQITFSGADVLGRHTVHLAKHCYEKTSFVSFDAKDVTAFMIPLMDPSCGMGSGNPPVGRPSNGSFVSGELIWLGSNELSPNPWRNIPDARSDEVKVAYVYTTQACAGAGRGCINPNPALGDSIQRVLERETGQLGYPYKIFARPGSFAVYAMAGLENTSTGDFIPYIMGTARNVLVGPGEEAFGTDIQMVVPLDHYLDVKVDVDASCGNSLGPDRYVAIADVDLGGEGVIRRLVSSEPIDERRSRSIGRPFRFFAQPALLDSLSDGRYRIEAKWVTGDFEDVPYTRVLRTGINEIDTEVVMTDFLGVPTPVAPKFGDRLPSDRILRWEANCTTPDFYMVLMLGGDGMPAWRHFVPGDVTEAPIPDLSSIPEISDIASGTISWAIIAVQSPGFDFNTFSYNDLNSASWSAEAFDRFTARL